MAIIQKIRDKYAKLAGGVIVLALIGFILMDYGRGGGGARSTTVGEINGEEIDFTAYEARINEREQQIQQQNPNAGMDETMRAQLRDQVWDEMVSEALLNDINDKLGITVTQAELNDLMVGPNPDPQVRQAFTNPQTGEFNPQEVSAQIQMLRSTADPNQKAAWEAFQAELVKRRYAEKFNALVDKAIYFPSFMLDDQYAAQQEVAGIAYVKLPYTLIADDNAKVSDEEIKKYMTAHKARFQVDKASRSIEYVSFNVMPSAEDSATILKELDQLKLAFETTEDAEVFVNRNSEVPMQPGAFTRDQLQGLPNVDELFSAPVNTVIGPFPDGNNLMLAKVLKKMTLPDSVKVRHILVKTFDQGNPVRLAEAAQARMDSALAALNAGVPFDSVVARFSDDPGSIATGGVYDFALDQRPGISVEFGDFAFEGKTGEKKTVEVNNNSYGGLHYIEILKQTGSEAVTELAFIAKTLEPSKTTYDNTYNKAVQFVQQTNSGKAFDQVARELGVTTATAEGLDRNSFLVSGLGSARELVQWSYEAETGHVSPIYTVGDDFVVARLSQVQPAGLLALTDQNRPMISAMVMKEKKAQLLLEKYKGSSLEAIAGSAGQTVASADSFRFAQAFIPGVGNEPKVVGYAFMNDLKPSSLSNPIPGNEGVYFLSLNYRTKAELNSPDRNKLMERNRQASALGNPARALLTFLKKGADVDDMRSNLYN